MSDNLQAKISDAYAQIKAGEAMFKEGLNALSNALEAVSVCEDILLQHGLNNLPKCTVPITEHRRQHRMGRVPKIDSDPELRTFVRSRIDRLSYEELAKEVADYFPKTRRVGKTAIFEWAKKQREEKI